MEANFFKAVAVMAIAVLCGSAAKAQNSESVNGDTATVVVPQVSNQKGQTTPRIVRVRKVRKTITGADSVLYKGGNVEVYEDRQLGSLTLAELRAINQGETKAVKRFNRNYDGQLRRGGYAGVVAGVIGFDPVDPEAGLVLGYHTWNWDFSLTGFWTNGHLPANSDEPGANYNSAYFYLDATWKALHTSNGYWSFGPGLGAGYGSQKTNWLNTGGSTNSGVTGRAFFAMNWQATTHFVLSLKAGGMLKVLVNHAQNGTESQKVDKNTIKPFIEASAKWYF